MNKSILQLLGAANHDCIMMNYFFINTVSVIFILRTKAY